MRGRGTRWTCSRHSRGSGRGCRAGAVPRIGRRCLGHTRRLRLAPRGAARRRKLQSHRRALAEGSWVAQPLCGPPGGDQSDLSVADSSGGWRAANGSCAVAAPAASRPPRPSTGGVAVYCRREPSRDAPGSLSWLRASSQERGPARAGCARGTRPARPQQPWRRRGASASSQCTWSGVGQWCATAVHSATHLIGRPIPVVGIPEPAAPWGFAPS